MTPLARLLAHRDLSAHVTDFSRGLELLPHRGVVDQLDRLLAWWPTTARASLVANALLEFGKRGVAFVRPPLE